MIAPVEVEVEGWLEVKALMPVTRSVEDTAAAPETVRVEKNAERRGDERIERVRVRERA